MTYGLDCFNTLGMKKTLLALSDSLNNNTKSIYPCQDKKNKNALYGILIGNKSYWGKGIGTEVTKLILDFGFKKIKLNFFLAFVPN